MTPKQILDIKIRAALAMGWTQVNTWDEANVLPDDTFYVSEHNVVAPVGYDLWEPDSDLNHAMMLAVKLYGNFDHHDKYIDLNLDDTGCAATIRYGEGFYDFAIAENNNPALALTLAVLKALEEIKRCSGDQ